MVLSFLVALGISLAGSRSANARNTAQLRLVLTPARRDSYSLRMTEEKTHCFATNPNFSNLQPEPLQLRVFRSAFLRLALVQPELFGCHCTELRRGRRFHKRRQRFELVLR